MGSHRKSIARWACVVASSLAACGLTATGVVARSADLYEWQPAYVQSAYPSGDAVPSDAEIVVKFGGAISPESVAVTVEPQISGELTWEDWSTIRWRPIGLPHSSRYHVRVRGRSVLGWPVKGQTSWDFTTAAGPALSMAPGPSSIRVPILMYHYIRVNPDPRDWLGYRLSVKPADFAAQMDWLWRNGYHTVTTLDLISYLNGSRGLPSKPIVLTFDDGYADFYTTAVPILRRYDFTAVAYVVSGFIGWGGYMTASQVRSLHRAGFEIGSHTVGHVNLTTQSSDQLAYQLAASKQALEQLVGSPVTAFCYPSGKFGWREANAVAAAGYLDATTTLGGSFRSMAGRYTWSRLRVSGGESLWEFSYAVIGDS